MLSAVTPSTNGRGGGAFAPAGRPTAVSGAFATPGTAAGTPPGVPTSSILESRNNRGSNVQIPYARLVPMHSRENIQATAHAARNGSKDGLIDKRLLVVNGRPQLEYDGLHTGELAWILGRRFKAPPGEDVGELGNTERYAHQAMGGMGNGVDRMQRLASTGWIESMFLNRFQGVKLELHNIRLDSQHAMAMDSNAKDLSDYIAGATVLRCPDITWWRAYVDGSADALKAVGKMDENVPFDGMRMQGINVMDTSPFLRGMQVDSKLIRLGHGKSTTSEDMARNIGDVVSMSVLENELRRRNIMDWTPDGVVLSKLESPTDEPMKSTEMDARQAQLFNVGIQGPAITPVWTADVKDAKLQVQPMDKVFIAVVATLSYNISDAADKQLEYVAVRNAHQDVVDAVADRDNAMKSNDVGAVKKAELKLKEFLEIARQRSAKFNERVQRSPDPLYDTLLKAINDGQDALKQATDEMRANLETVLRNKQVQLETLFEAPSQNDLKIMRIQAEAVRANKRLVTKANLSNFKLKRTTSSHMTGYSFYKQGNDNSRLQLKLGKLQDTGEESEGYLTGVREVVVGAWCIGTVLDSAASRSTVGFQTVKSHPTSMAINLNVNVQWWSGDKLYKHYYDAGGLVMARGVKRDFDSEGAPKQPLTEDIDKLMARNTNFPPIMDMESSANLLRPDGTPDTGPFIPPMQPREPRSVRARTEAAGTSASAFGRSMGSASGGLPAGARRA